MSVRFYKCVAHLPEIISGWRSVPQKYIFALTNQDEEFELLVSLLGRINEESILPCTTISPFSVQKFNSSYQNLAWKVKILLKNYIIIKNMEFLLFKWI